MSLRRMLIWRCKELAAYSKYKQTHCGVQGKIKRMHLSICFLPGPVVHVLYTIDLFSPSDESLLNPDNITHSINSHKRKLELRE